MSKFINRSLIAAGSLAVAGVANAATDTAAITAAGTEVAAIGAAVFVVMVGIKVIKWVRRAL